MHRVYINAFGTFLPGLPIPNSLIEQYIGMIDGQRSRNGVFVLRQNKIKTRHYAIDENGCSQFSNAEMAANAIKAAVNDSEVSLRDIELLVTSTTIGDMMLPGLASHVQAELGIGPIEIGSYQSVCASSLMAIKSAFLQLQSGEHRCAAVSGSEFASRYLKASFYQNATDTKEKKCISLNADFLRFTLSDGAGAAVLENKPNERGLSLKIDWIDIQSYSHQFETCMSGGIAENKPWGDYPNPAEAEQKGALMLTQKLDALKSMIPIWISHYLQIVDQKNLLSEPFDYFCSHYSSHSLRVDAINLLEKTGAHIPPGKWFSNLSTKGNTGTASIFIILDELFKSNKLQKGQRILCHVPESGRCLNAFMMLEVV